MPLPTPSSFADALILTGPTGSGKSAVALELAERIGAEIVAMDSMTLYRGMDIGTAKPTLDEQARVPHHLIDVLEPWESGNVAWWLERAAEACSAIRSRGRRPLFVGGTPFYLKALLYGLFEAPPSNPELRRQLEAEAVELGPIAFHARLAAIDPITAARLHPNDVRRIVRAREVFELTGQPISQFQQSWDSPTFGGRSSETRLQTPCVILDWPREILYQRIETRIDTMLTAGWLDEVRQLQQLPRPLSPEASLALGYRELAEFSREERSDWDAIILEIKTRTRQFAKRQLTWFRNFKTGTWVSASNPTVLEQIEAAWKDKS